MHAKGTGYLALGASGARGYLASQATGLGRATLQCKLRAGTGYLALNARLG